MTNETKIKKIFLADDDEDDQLIFSEAVAAIDPSIQIDIAFNGKDALLKLNQMQSLPDLIFLDINMPLMDGFECLREIKLFAKYLNIPVIIYSTSHALSMVETSERLHADAFLTKPTSQKQLEMKLEKIFSTDFTIPSEKIRIFSHYDFSIFY
jgi:CheY-like chemotaxis protein